MKEKLEAEAVKRRQTLEEYARTVVEKSLPLTAWAGRAWSEIEGAAKFPLAGEDAQAWVTRTRREEETEVVRARCCVRKRGNKFLSLNGILRMEE